MPRGLGVGGGGGDGTLEGGGNEICLKPAFALPAARKLVRTSNQAYTLKEAGWVFRRRVAEQL